jgi:DNA-binding GntR family transcriptional regulator
VIALHRVSTGDALVAALQEQVLDGTLAGGTPLREADLRDTFGVSRHTVRTALQTLAHRGLVRLEPNRSASVPLLTPDDVHDLFRLRMVLELTAARQTRGQAAALAPARAAVVTLERLGADTPWGEVRDADIAFHAGLIDAMGSARISRAFGPLAAELRLCFVQLRRELVDPPLVAAQHREILTALETGKGKAAVSLLQEHLERSEADIVAGYQELAADRA